MYESAKELQSGEGPLSERVSGEQYLEATFNEPWLPSFLSSVWLLASRPHLSKQMRLELALGYVLMPPRFPRIILPSPMLERPDL